MKQTIEIEVPEGKKAVWKDGKITFEVIKLPKTWEDFCKENPIREDEVYITTTSKILTIGRKRERGWGFDKNLFPSEKVAKQHLALMQLHRLRDCYRQGWIPNWEDMDPKYCIINVNNGYCVVEYNNIKSFLSFRTERLANDFLNNFKDLIKQAGDLI